MAIWYDGFGPFSFIDTITLQFTKIEWLIVSKHVLCQENKFHTDSIIRTFPYIANDSM